MLSFLCIAYLQSLSSPLLPNLQSKDLIAKLNPPPSEAALPVRRTHVGLETVDTTFVSIGLTPPLREKLGWKQGTEADREFARDWVGKGKGGPPLKDLLRGFYMVYGGKAREMFDWDTGVVSVSSGGLKMRHDVKGNRSWSRGTLVVQHPFVETIVRTSFSFSSTNIVLTFLPFLFVLFAESHVGGEGRTRPDRRHVPPLPPGRTPSRRCSTPRNVHVQIPQSLESLTSFSSPSQDPYSSRTRLSRPALLQINPPILATHPWLSSTGIPSSLFVHLSLSLSLSLSSSRNSTLLLLSRRVFFFSPSSREPPSFVRPLNLRPIPPVGQTPIRRSCSSRFAGRWERRRRDRGEGSGRSGSRDEAEPDASLWRECCFSIDAT